MELRNIAIIAHVDHGKTTLVDEMLKQSGRVPRKSGGRRACHGLRTILSASAASPFWRRTPPCTYKGDRRSTSSIRRATPTSAARSSACSKWSTALSCSWTRPKAPCRRRALCCARALELGHRVIVVVNKIDRPDQRIHEVVDEVLELLMDLDATDEQLDSPMLFCSGRQGTASYSPDVPGTDLQAAVRHDPRVYPRTRAGHRRAVPDARFLASTITSIVGRIAIGRIERGTIKPESRRSPSATITIAGRCADARRRPCRFTSSTALHKVPVTEATAGNIIAMSGIGDVTIGDTICAAGACRAAAVCEDLRADAGNDVLRQRQLPSPDARASLSPARQIRDRLYPRNAQGRFPARRRTSRAAPTASMLPDAAKCRSRILIETMRREGL